MATLYWLGASLAQGLISMALLVGAIWIGSLAAARWSKALGWIIGIATFGAMILGFETFHHALGHAH
jgi:hypothetical protein